MNIKRIVLLSSILLLSSYIYVANKNYCRDCNVVLISIDTLRADHLSTYGYSKKTSPYLDEFSKNSVVYKNFYSTSSWTLPAHASMFASDTPSNLKTASLFDKLPESALTISEVLGKNGYYTYGFDSNTYVSPSWNFSQGFNGYTVERSNPNVVDANLIFPHAEKWLQQNKDKKFFLFLHAFEVHDPYCPPEPYASKFKGNYTGKVNCVNLSMILENISKKKVLSTEELNRFVSLYDGEISYTDYYLGMFLKKLKDLDIDKKTIVIITSDHGEEFGDHGTWGEHIHTLYNELIHIPLIIKSPTLQPGVKLNPVSMVDVAPTILDLVGIKKPVEFKGESVLQDLHNKKIFFELSDTQMQLRNRLAVLYKAEVGVTPRERKDESLDKIKVGVLLNDWKLIRSFNPQMIELYNIKQDPYEKNNLAFDERTRTKALEILIMRQYKLENHTDLDKIQKNLPKQEELDKLKGIGY